MDEPNAETACPGVERRLRAFAKGLGESIELLRLSPMRDDVVARYYSAGAASMGVVFVGGKGCGWNSPAQGLYPRLAHELATGGLAGLHLRAREQEVVAHDVLTGVAFLQSEGVTRLALVGHSSGGAAVIRAAAGLETVRLVLTLASQDDIGNVGVLARDCALVLIHGRKDKIVSAYSSCDLYAKAHAPKELMILQDEEHALDNDPSDVYKRVRSAIGRWLIDKRLG